MSRWKVGAVEAVLNDGTAALGHVPDEGDWIDTTGPSDVVVRNGGDVSTVRAEREPCRG